MFTLQTESYTTTCGGFIDGGTRYALAGLVFLVLAAGCKSKADEDYARGVEELKAGHVPEARALFAAASSNSKAAEELAKIDEGIKKAITTHLVGRSVGATSAVERSWGCGEFGGKITTADPSLTQVAPAAEASGQWLIKAHVKGACAGITCKGLGTSECLTKITQPNQTVSFESDYRVILATTHLGEVSVNEAVAEKEGYVTGKK
jgi:hypothetical protein